MKSNIKVTVIIPTFNSEKILDRAVQSVLMQTFQEFEILICDDASTDSTVELAKLYAQKDSRISVLVLPENRGAGAARNLGLEKARGKYIAFLDSDDEWLSKKLEIQVKCMDQQPDEVGVCFCGAKIIKNNDLEKEVFYTPKKSWEEGTFKKFALDKIPFLTPTIFFRRECLVKTGLMVDEMRRNQDGEFLLRLFKYYKLFVIPEVHALIHLWVSNNKKVYERTKNAYYFWLRHEGAIKKELGFWCGKQFVCFRTTYLINLGIREKKWQEVRFWVLKRLQISFIFWPSEILCISRSIGSLFLNR